MFAFCPITKKGLKACGPSKLIANATVQNFTSLGGSMETAIRYENNGSKGNRSYDACYYEISSVPKQELKFTDLKDGLRVYVRLNKQSGMNVFVYGGSNRENATEWIMFGDAPQVEIDRNYTFPID